MCNARDDARWLISRSRGADSVPVSGDIERAIKHAVEFGNLNELSIALEQAANSDGHAGGSGVARAVENILTEWLRDTDTRGEAA